jgi:hypothetical protein
VEDIPAGKFIVANFSQQIAGGTSASFTRGKSVRFSRCGMKERTTTLTKAQTFYE